MSKRTIIYINKKADVEKYMEQAREFCIRNSYEIKEALVEKFGTKEEFNKMLCMIREMNVEYIYIPNMEGLSRNYTESTEMINQLAEAGIKGIILSNGEVLDGYFLNREFNEEMTSIFEQADIYNPAYKIRGTRVAIYHLSLDPIRSGCIELQMKILRSFSKRKNWSITKEYIELTNIKGKKEQEKLLLKEAGEFDIVLVKNAYYFSRETSSFLTLRNKLLEKGVRIFSLNEGWC